MKPGAIRPGHGCLTAWLHMKFVNFLFREFRSSYLIFFPIEMERKNKVAFPVPCPLAHIIISMAIVCSLFILPEEFRIIAISASTSIAVHLRGATNDDLLHLFYFPHRLKSQFNGMPRNSAYPAQQPWSASARVMISSRVSTFCINYTGPCRLNEADSFFSPVKNNT